MIVTYTDPLEPSWKGTTTEDVLPLSDLLPSCASAAQQQIDAFHLPLESLSLN
jgi:hypothetical protein